MTKPGSLRPGPISEPALQTYTVPLDCAEPLGLDAEAVESLALVMTGIPPGGVFVDNLGVPGEVG